MNITGDFRSAVQRCLDEPWRIDCVVYAILTNGRPQSWVDYACGVLQRTRTGRGAQVYLDDILYCTCHASVADQNPLTMAGLAWAAVMEPIVSPLGWVPNVVFYPPAEEDKHLGYSSWRAVSYTSPNNEPRLTIATEDGSSLQITDRHSSGETAPYKEVRWAVPGKPREDRVYLERYYYDKYRRPEE